MLLACLAAVLAVKAVVLAQLGDHPLLQPEGEMDGAVYLDLARRVSQGDLVLAPDPYFVSPLYVYFLGAVLGLAGSTLLARVLQIGLGTVAVALVFRTARTWAGEGAAWWAAALVAATGVLTFNEILILQSALDPFLTALQLFLLSRALGSGRGRDYLAAGLALGLHVLNRPNLLLWAGALTLLLALRSRLWTGGQRPRAHPVSTGMPGSLARHLLPGAAVALGVGVAILPVTLRNHMVSGEWIAVTSHGGLNFYIGNNAAADGTYHGVPGITPDIRGQSRDAVRVASARLGHRASTGEASDHFYREAGRWISGHPADALALFARKLAYVFNDVDLGLNYSYAFFGRDEPTLLRALAVGPWLLVPLGLLGLLEIGWSRRGGGAALWASFVVVYAVSVALFFVSSRYRLPLLVPLAVGSGRALAQVQSAWAARRIRKLGIYAPAVAALAALALWPTGLDDGRTRERGALLLHLVAQGRDAEAEARLSEVVGEHPEPGVLLYSLGRAFQDRGRPGRAAELFRQALHREPGRPAIELGLGQVLLDLGRADEAETHLRVALEAGHRTDLAAFDLARALAALDRAPEAASVLQNLTPARSADIASRLAVGELALRLERGDLALRFLEPAVGEPPSGRLLELRGLALALLARDTEALLALEAACWLEPTRASPHLNLAIVLARRGRFEEAGRRVREALRLRPDYPQAQALLRALQGARPSGPAR